MLQLGPGKGVPFWLPLYCLHIPDHMECPQPKTRTPVPEEMPRPGSASPHPYFPSSSGTQGLAGDAGQSEVCSPGLVLLTPSPRDWGAGALRCLQGLPRSPRQALTGSRMPISNPNTPWNRVPQEPSPVQPQASLWVLGWLCHLPTQALQSFPTSSYRQGRES